MAIERTLIILAPVFIGLCSFGVCGNKVRFPWRGVGVRVEAVFGLAVGVSSAVRVTRGRGYHLLSGLGFVITGSAAKGEDQPDPKDSGYEPWDEWHQ